LWRDVGGEGSGGDDSGREEGCKRLQTYQRRNERGLVVRNMKRLVGKMVGAGYIDTTRDPGREEGCKGLHTEDNVYRQRNTNSRLKHTHTHADSQKHAHTYMNTHTHAHAHTHIHTHTLTGVHNESYGGAHSNESTPMI